MRIHTNFCILEHKFYCTMCFKGAFASQTKKPCGQILGWNLPASPPSLFDEPAPCWLSFWEASSEPLGRQHLSRNCASLKQVAELLVVVPLVFVPRKKNLPCRHFLGFACPLGLKRDTWVSQTMWRIQRSWFWSSAFQPIISVHAAVISHLLDLRVCGAGSWRRSGEFFGKT